MALLEVADLHAAYGDVRVLHGVSFSVDAGEAVVLLGANGAGKTTTLSAVSRVSGLRTSGTIRFDGADLMDVRADQLAGRGIAHVPQGRGTFAPLTVEENLQVGAFSRRDRHVTEDIDRWYELFPLLSERREQSAGSLSGGEQQMLAVARALMSRPRLLLLDEPSMGLAPIVVADLFERLGLLGADAGIAMLMVEQNASVALRIADRGYVLEAGEIVLDGTAAELQQSDEIRRAYLGV